MTDTVQDIGHSTFTIRNGNISYVHVLIDGRFVQFHSANRERRQRVKCCIQWSAVPTKQEVVEGDCIRKRITGPTTMKCNRTVFKSYQFACLGTWPASLKVKHMCSNQGMELRVVVVYRTACDKETLWRALVRFLFFWDMAMWIEGILSIFVGYSTLECEARTLSRNIGHKPPSDVVPCPRTPRKFKFS